MVSYLLLEVFSDYGLMKEEKQKPSRQSVRKNNIIDVSSVYVAFNKWRKNKKYNVFNYKCQKKCYNYTGDSNA